MNSQNTLKLLTCVVMIAPLSSPLLAQSNAHEKPNILFAISDDQSWLHTSINGSKAVNTPAFDRVATQGVLFRNAFASAPQCSPDRASILTGRSIWQLEEAGTHGSICMCGTSNQTAGLQAIQPMQPKPKAFLISTPARRNRS